MGKSLSEPRRSSRTIKRLNYFIVFRDSCTLKQQQSALGGLGEVEACIGVGGS